MAGACLRKKEQELLSEEISQQGRQSVQLSRLEQIQTLFNNALDAVVGMNEKGIITDWNGQAETIFGWSKAEILGRTVAETIIPSEYRKHHEAGLMNFFKTGIGRVLNARTELTALKKDKTEFQIELTVTPIKTESSFVFYAFIRDITKRKEAEEYLQKAKEDAEAASQAKSTFLANMSHEVRTPLGVILGFSELLANREITTSEKERYIATIRRNGELLLNVIDDILDLSKVEAGKLKVENLETNVSEILTDVILQLKPKAAAKNIILSETVAPDIPQLIMSDPLRLNQILVNIVGNAIKFTEQGAVSVTLSVLAPAGSAPKLVFVVKDSGIGLSKSQADKLFQLFFQADFSAKRKFGGTGLGLAISKHLAKILGGDVILTESTLGQGSTFTITIAINPVMDTQLKGDEEKIKEKNKAMPEADAALKLDGIKILLVEDSADNQLMFNKLLKLAGALVDTAENGAIALEKIYKNKYDVVLMDIQTPIMDGYETIAKLRNDGYKIPIIALTAHALKEERTRSLAGGFNDHISKPINGISFIETIAQHIPSKR